MNPPKKNIAIKKSGKEKAEAILKFASLFINEFLKMMKNSQILVNPKKHSNKKKEEKKKAAAKVRIPLVFVF